jgi:hypothetical protein
MKHRKTKIIPFVNHLLLTILAIITISATDKTLAQSTTSSTTTTSPQLQGTMTYEELRKKLATQQSTIQTTTSYQDKTARPLAVVRTIQAVRTSK